MPKDIEYYMRLPYQEVIEANPNGGYVGYIKDLRGCISEFQRVCIVNWLRRHRLGA